MLLSTSVFLQKEQLLINVRKCQDEYTLQLLWVYYTYHVSAEIHMNIKSLL